MNFYFDDFTHVTCDSDYQGPATLRIDTQSYVLYFHHGSASMPEHVKLRKRYSIEIQETLYPVIYRFLVCEEAFHTMCAYRGPLGAIYSPLHTDFYVWAPTAYALRIVIIDRQTYPATCNEQGVYHVRIEGDLDGVGYMLEVEHEKICTCLDPYAISSAKNSAYNFVINREKLPKVIPLQKEYTKEQTMIYEVSVRDFSMDPKSSFQHRGTFDAMIQENVTNTYGKPVGFDYLKSLGITHVQLLPIYDFGSLEEDYQNRSYNWGYDPVQYQVIEGKYSLHPEDPYTRIKELIHLVADYHKVGLAVNMDVVYNHVYDERPFSYDVLVPYYFIRYDGDKKSNASYCGNEVASQHPMVRRFMIDSLVYLTKTFDFSGYRFDLMGIHDIQTMQEIEQVLTHIKEEIVLYGEGWTLPTAIPHEECAIQKNHAQMQNISFFHDDFRDTLKVLVAGYPIYHTEDVIKRMLLSLDYTRPQQAIQYVSCHDDYTLYDHLFYEFQVSDVINRMKLAYCFVFLSQGIPFLHAGCEWGRTKMGIKNTYQSSDAINRLDWDLKDENAKLCDFVKQLIQFRKQHLPIYKTKEEACEQIQITYEDEVVHYHVKTGLHMYINCSKQVKQIQQAGICLFSEMEEMGMLYPYSLIAIQE